MAMRSAAAAGRPLGDALPLHPGAPKGAPPSPRRGEGDAPHARPRQRLNPTVPMGPTITARYRLFIVAATISLMSVGVMMVLMVVRVAVIVPVTVVMIVAVVMVIMAVIMIMAMVVVMMRVAVIVQVRRAMGAARVLGKHQ